MYVKASIRRAFSTSKNWEKNTLTKELSVKYDYHNVS